jgi:uncharacterized membrane protein
VNQTVAGQAVPYRSLATVAYALQALYFVSGFGPLAAVAINYWKMDEVRGTWLESHFRWQMDTFWGFFNAWAVFIVLMLMYVGLVGRPSPGAGGLGMAVAIAGVLLALHGWYAYRIARGWSRLNRSEPMS